MLLCADICLNFGVSVCCLRKWINCPQDKHRHYRDHRCRTYRHFSLLLSTKDSDLHVFSPSFFKQTSEVKVCSACATAKKKPMHLSCHDGLLPNLLMCSACNDTATCKTMSWKTSWKFWTLKHAPVYYWPASPPRSFFWRLLVLKQNSIAPSHFLVTPFHYSRNPFLM